jgi:hypothetical protein
MLSVIENKEKYEGGRIEQVALPQVTAEMDKLLHLSLSIVS